jgi:hypothetical protein
MYAAITYKYMKIVKVKGAKWSKPKIEKRVNSNLKLI